LKHAALPNFGPSALKCLVICELYNVLADKKKKRERIDVFITYRPRVSDGFHARGSFRDAFLARARVSDRSGGGTFAFYDCGQLKKRKRERERERRRRKRNTDTPITDLSVFSRRRSRGVFVFLLLGGRFLLACLARTKARLTDLCAYRSSNERPADARRTRYFNRGG